MGLSIDFLPAVLHDLCASLERLFSLLGLLGDPRMIFSLLLQRFQDILEVMQLAEGRPHLGALALYLVTFLRGSLATLLEAMRLLIDYASV